MENPIGFLPQLCELDLLDRERRAAERRLKAARFPSSKTREGFYFKGQPSLNQPLAIELMRCAYVCVDFPQSACTAQ